MVESGHHPPTQLIGEGQAADTCDVAANMKGTGDLSNTIEALDKEGVSSHSFVIENLD